MPVLAFAGALSMGRRTEEQIRLFATDIASVILDDCGHYPAEEKPAELLAHFQACFRPYAQDGGRFIG